MEVILYFFRSNSKVSDFSKVSQEKHDIKICLIQRDLSIANFFKILLSLVPFRLLDQQPLTSIVQEYFPVL